MTPALHPSSIDGLGEVQAFRVKGLVGDHEEPAERVFLVSSGRFLAVCEEDVSRFGVHTSAEVDLDGWVMPGLIDAHMHAAMAAAEHSFVSLPSRYTPVVDDFRNRFREVAEDTPQGEWIFAKGYSGTLDGPLNRSVLDSLLPDHPILVKHIAGHWAVTNSRGLATAGYGAIEDAPKGGRLGADGTDRLDGFLFEAAYTEILNTQGATDPIRGGARQGLRAVLREMRRTGLTGHCEAHVGTAEARILAEAASMGALYGRVWLLLTPELAREWQGGELTGVPSAEVVGVKLYLDGSLGGATCLRQDEDGRVVGESTVTESELATLVEEFHRKRLSVAVHANGDVAISRVLTAFSRIIRRDPWVGHRHRIEHGSMMNESQAKQASSLGLAVVPFGSYIRHYGHRLQELYGQRVAAELCNHRVMLEAGLLVAGSSDHPCAPVNPWEGIASMVTRRTIDDIDVGTNNRVSLSQAIETYTRAPATLLGRGHELGVIRPGFLADFIVLEENPLLADPEELSCLSVADVYINGSRVGDPDG